MDMADGASTESLPVNLGQEYRVKLGKSFTFPEKNAFHTLKYDFKPHSIDTKRPGQLKITEEGAVNVSLPVGQEYSGDDVAQFRGPKKSCTKECILIINSDTGEAILERISDTVQLKAIRDSRRAGPSSRDRSPSPYLSQPKAPPPKQTFKSSNSLLTPSSTKLSQATGTNASQSNKKPKLSSKPTTASSKQDSGGKHLSSAPQKAMMSSSATTAGKIADKGKVKFVKSQNKSSQLGSSVSSSSFNPTGMELGTIHEISPLRSGNPTPEPIVHAGSKRPTSSSSSSSSDSSSSDSDDSMDEDDRNTPPAGHVIAPASHVTTQMPNIPQPIKSTSSLSTSQFDSSRGNTFSQQLKANPPITSLHHSQRADSSGKITRTSSAGRPAVMARPSPARFMDESSAQLLNRASSANHRPLPQTGSQSSSQQQQQYYQQSLQTESLSVDHARFPNPGGSGPPNSSGGPGGITIDTSSSSDSGSSSGSSSSDSSSESENDREVAHAFSRPEPSRQMSMSVLHNDLNLSESGSDSD